MILANSIIGSFLKKNKIKSIFRNHEKPSREKIANLKKIINDNKLNYSGEFSESKGLLIFF